MSTETMWVYNAYTMIIIARIKHFNGYEGCEEIIKEHFDLDENLSTSDNNGLVDNGDWEDIQIADENGNI